MNKNLLQPELSGNSLINTGLVSIIIPCHNQGRYLGEAVQSIRNQKYENWECLIIDDGSTDETEAISLQFCKVDKRIQYFRQKNKGVSSARNLGLSKSNGDFIQFLDADDKLECEKIRISLKLFAGQPILDGVVSDARYFNDSNPTELKYNIFDNNEWLRFLWKDNNKLLKSALTRNLTPVNCPMIRRKLFERVGFFDEKMRACEDWDFWLRCFAVTNSFIFLQADHTRALIRTHKDSISQSREKMYVGEFSLILKTSRMFDKSDLLYSSCRDIAISRLKNNVRIWNISQLYKLVSYFPSYKTLSSLPELFSLRFKIVRLLLHSSKSEAELRLYYTEKKAYINYKKCDHKVVKVAQSLNVSKDFILNRLVDYFLSIKYTSSQIRPFPGFHPEVYSDFRKVELTESFFDYLKQGFPTGTWNLRILKTSPQEVKSIASLKTALHIHLHYIDDLDDILERINSSKNSPDLFFSVTTSESLKYITAKTSEITRYKIKVKQFPNAGRNIGPLFTGFSADLSTYDVIGHVHGKKSPHLEDRDFLNSWKSFLFDNMLGGTKPMVDYILREFEEHPLTGVIFPDDPISYGWGNNRVIADRLLDVLKISNPCVSQKHVIFPVGMMFWARREALQPFFDLNFTWDDYPTEPIDTDGTILHAIERVLPIVSSARGLESVVTAERFFDRTMPE